MAAIQLVVIIAVALLSGVLSQGNGNPVFGAIFTTLPNGETVNSNVYTDKYNVYLSGGPQVGCSQAGLPDGEYYYQVTTPAGKVLLSEDPIECRTAVVVNGYWTGGGSCLNESCCHAETVYTPGCTGPQQMQTQLMPYADTPDPGGEYKVWATKVVDFDYDNYLAFCNDPMICGAMSQAERRTGFSFGFADAASKTDNFKVRVADQPPPITATPTPISESANSTAAPAVAVVTPGCVGEAIVTECLAASDCERCGTVEIIAREVVDDGMSLTYKVCNRCDNAVQAVWFGLESPVTLAEAPDPDRFYLSGLLEQEWTVAITDGNEGQLPAYRAMAWTPRHDSNKLREGACDTFTFTVVNWNPDWQQNFLVLAGSTYDGFANIKVGQCECPECTSLNLCPDGLVVDCPDDIPVDEGVDELGADLADDTDCPDCESSGSCPGGECTLCEDSSDWIWWCVPTGSGAYQLTRLVGRDDNLPTEGYRAGSTDDDGYELTCQCERLFLSCCPDCASCNDATGECTECPNPSSTLDPHNTDHCCTLPAGAVMPCGMSPCGDNQVCAGANNTDEGACECVSYVDGSFYTSEGCTLFVEGHVRSTFTCDQFNCNDCRFAGESGFVENGCEWCADACRPAGFCDTPIDECIVGVMPFTPGFCPQDCNGQQCNTTSGLCICKGKNSGLNCGSQAGLSAVAVGGIAAGAIVGIVIGACIFAVIVLITIAVISYATAAKIVNSEYMVNFAHDNALYRGSESSGENPMHSPRGIK